MTTTAGPRPAHRTADSRDNLLAALSGVVQVSPRSSQAQFQSQPPLQHHSSSYSGVQPMTNREVPHSLPGTSLLPGEDPLAPAPPPVPTKSSGGMATKFANAFRRQTTEDKAAKKAAEGGVALGRSKTVSTRMDIIDKLDVSGIHGDSLFHHDSPYDACSPHANRSTKRAPVGAFDPNIDPMTGRPFGYTRNARNAGQSKQSLSPLASATLQRAGEADAAYSEDSALQNHSRPPFVGKGARSATSPLVPSLPMTGNQASSSAVNLDSNHSSHNRGADTASVTTESSDWDNDRWGRGGGNANIRRAPNAIEDMWGHVAEPWQDFAQPKQDKSRGRNNGGVGSSNGRGGAGSQGSGDANGMLSPYARDGPPSAASSVFDMEAVMTGKTAAEKKQLGETLAGVSPFPEPDYNRAGGGYENTAPKRSKSLIKRIKSARQNPNVPPPDDDGVEMSSSGGRARSKRYGPHAHKHSPSSPPESESPRGNDWSSLTSGNLGMGGGDGSLGRSSTRKATQEEQARYRQNRLAPPTGSGNGSNASSPALAPAGYFEGAGANSNTDVSSSGEEYRSGGRARSPREGGGAGGVGRSGSIFGRFGRKNKPAAA